MKLWFRKNASAAALLPPSSIDFGLLFTVVGMVIFGLIMVYSSSFIYAQEKTGDGFAFITKQLLIALLGFGALLGVCRIPYRKWAGWAFPMFGVAIVLLALVLVPGIGAKVGGAQRWLRAGPLNFQAGEFAKLAMILFTARLLDRKWDSLGRFVPGVVSPFLYVLPMLALLLFQPDFGTVVMISLTLFAMLFISGVPRRFLGGAVLFAGTIATYLALSTPYRRMRVSAFLDPWSDPTGKGFQILQSLVGLHNGSIFGAGLGNGKEKLFYLPEAHNDFIFAVIGEELGFVGIAGVALAYLIFLYRGLKIGVNCYERHGDRFGMLTAVGITLALGFQGFTNMAVVLGLVPTKGLALPFISYGGSALLMHLIAIGILLSIARGPNPQSDRA